MDIHQSSAVPVIIFFDSTGAINHALCKTAPVANIDIVSLAVVLRQRIQQLDCYVCDAEIEHVHARVGHPWNEFAGSLAKGAAHATFQSNGCLPAARSINVDSRIAWAPNALGYTHDMLLTLQV